MIRENQKMFNKLNVVTDIAIMFISMIAAYLLRFYVFKVDTEYIKLVEYIKFTVFLIPLQLIIYMFFDLYGSFRSKSFSRECVTLIKANTIFIAIILAVLFVFKIIHISRWLMVAFYFVYLTFIVAKRFVLRKALSKIRKKGLNLKSVIIIGSGEIASDYLNVIKKKREYGYQYSGFVANENSLDGMHLGNYDSLYDILQNQKPDEVVCAIDMKDANQLENIVACCEQTGTKISIIPFCYKFMPSQPYIDQIDSIPLINIRRIPLDNIANAFLKRALDIVGSLCLIILSSPFMIFAAIGVKLTSKGPIIFKQQRVGLNKKNFMMYKFRSMKINTQQDTAWSTNADPRKTKFGSFIRKFSIDELPQFFNVLLGDMSLVGPRPELPHFVENFQKEIPLYMVKHQVKPGITGWAQINGYRGDTSIKKRIEHDIYYIENWNFFFDISILFSTVFKGFKNDEVIIKKHIRRESKMHEEISSITKEA